MWVTKLRTALFDKSLNFCLIVGKNRIRIEFLPTKHILLSVGIYKKTSRAIAL